MKLIAVAPVDPFRATASMHLVPLYCSNIHRWPLEGGLVGPVRSEGQVWNGQGVDKLCSSAGGACIWLLGSDILGSGYEQKKWHQLPRLTNENQDERSI